MVALIILIILRIGGANWACHIHLQGNISMDEEGELLFSGAAEHLRKYEPPVEDDIQGKLTQRKLSQRLVPRNLDHLKELQKDHAPFQSRKCKSLPPAVSPNLQRTTPGDLGVFQKGALRNLRWRRALANHLKKNRHKLPILRPMTKE